jgi:ABC-type sugar transport system substrate-binding protein
MTRLVSLLVLCSLAGATGCQKGERVYTVGFMPKLRGIPYFNACKRGAEEAARERGIKLVYDGPETDDSNRQIEMLDQWINSGSYDCVAVACNNSQLVAPTLKSAADRGLPVITYDADATPDARRFFVNMATYDAVARAMVDAMAEDLEPNGEGKVGILTSSIQAPNQSAWARRIYAYAREKYPKMKLLEQEQHGEDRTKGISQAKAMIQAHKDLKGIIGLTSVSLPAAAEAVRQSGKKGEIRVTGVSTPKDMRDYVKDGTVKTVILWNPVDLGYLTVVVADLNRQGKMPASGTIEAGRLGIITVTDREVLLGKPMRFTRENIDQFDF